MKVLVIGGGGREHALAWKVAQSERVDEVLVAPGNAGTAGEAKCRNVPVAAEDIDALLALAQKEAVDLTIVGPEAPLAAGVVDRFTAAGLACFGPDAGAAQLESSKAFAKDFMARHEIPTAAYGVAETLEQGLELIRSIGLPLVLKADGLAAGKGVVIVETETEAEATLRDMLSGESFGEAGRRVVIEEFLEGEEASFIVIADGLKALPLATSQDHKRRDEGDRGPNTGGMGAYSPAPVVTPELHRQILDEIIRPTLAGMQSDGHSFTGFLYAGVMLTERGPKVLEFNVRFGDPETQPVMMRLRSDLVEVLERTLKGELDRIELDWDPRVALGVVVAAGGYPEAYEKGKAIDGLDRELPEDVRVFHAGTRLGEDGRILTSGGRVLCVTALGKDVGSARERALEAASTIHFDQAFLRRDIGHRALSREA
ncbi:phosphoribosylamine--glycine ligase [Leptolyngbya valderiana BDU 20041]|nr:phosphoribosylamine--glycine ligase [Leptolyngbya valderiana BDU 20041]